jgi:hypothetical protein
VTAGLAYALLRWWDSGPHSWFGMLVDAYDGMRAAEHGIPSIFD